MFTSLFQLEQKPVTVFSSDDVGAPVLTKDAGSLKTLLKTCLVTGYGDKAALGWQMLFESADTLSAAFASADPTASKYVIKINNSTATSAKISAYQSMVDIDTGLGALAVDNDYELFSGAWRLIGHSKAFILLLDVSYHNSTKMAYPIMFGDLPKQTNSMGIPVVFWTARKSGFYQSSIQRTLENYPDGNTVNSSSGSNNYPVVLALGSTVSNVTASYCKFGSESFAVGTLLYEPYIIATASSTWTMLPMLQPMSQAALELGNLSKISSSTLLVRTSNLPDSFNSSSVVQTDWWYA